MPIFKIIETREIIKGFYDLTYEVEAPTKEEALRIFNENPEDALFLDQDLDIKNSEFLNLEINEQKN